MKQRRIFNSLIVRTSAGRFRWVVSHRGETVAHGYARSKIEARKLSLDEQHRVFRTYQERGIATERAFCRMK